MKINPDPESSQIPTTDISHKLITVEHSLDNHEADIAIEINTSFPYIFSFQLL